MAGLVQACPGYPRSAASKTRPTPPRPSANAYRTRISGRVARFWSFVEPNHVDSRGTSPAMKPSFAAAGPSPMRRSPRPTANTMKACIRLLSRELLVSVLPIAPRTPRHGRACPGLSRPSTPHRVKDESDIGASHSKGLHPQSFSALLLSRRRLMHRNAWVAGSSPIGANLGRRRSFGVFVFSGVRAGAGVLRGGFWPCGNRLAARWRR